MSVFEMFMARGFNYEVAIKRIFEKSINLTLTDLYFVPYGMGKDSVMVLALYDM